MRRNSEEKLSVEHFHPWDTTFITGLSDYRFTAGLLDLTCGFMRYVQVLQTDSV